MRPSPSARRDVRHMSGETVNQPSALRDALSKVIGKAIRDNGYITNDAMDEDVADKVIAAFPALSSPEAQPECPRCGHSPCLGPKCIGPSLREIALEKALRPFAKEAGYFLTDRPDTAKLGHVVTIGDCRHARALLAGSKP